MDVRKSLIAGGMVIVAAFAAISNLPVVAAHAPAKNPRLTSAKPPHVIPELGALNAANLVAIARLGSNPQADQFSDNPSLKYVGRDFSFTLDADKISANYDTATHRLTVSGPSYSDEFVLDRQITKSRYVGRNSFGASATISKERGDTYGVESPWDGIFQKPISFETDLDGDAARALSKALCLRLTGKIKKATGVYAIANSALSEKSDISDATVAEPYDTWIKNHRIAADITKAEWIDTRSGTVMKTEDFPIK